MTISPRQVQFTALGLLASLLTLGLVYQAHGQTPSPDIEKQVIVLRKVVEDQKKQLDGLQAEFSQFKAAQIR